MSEKWDQGPISFTSGKLFFFPSGDVAKQVVKFMDEIEMAKTDLEFDQWAEKLEADYARAEDKPSDAKKETD